MLGFDTLLNAVSIELSRVVTGKLSTDAQSRSLASHAVGKYFADWLPEPKEQRTARERRAAFGAGERRSVSPTSQNLTRSTKP